MTTFATHSRDLALTGPREQLRSTYLSLAASFRRATGYFADRFRIPRVHIVYLHHVFPDEETNFAATFRALQQHHSFISLSDAVARVRSGQIDKPYFAVTFDDGLKTTRRAAQILHDLRIPACFYICPSVVGLTERDQVAQFCTQRLQYPPMELLDWNDVDAMRTQGHEFGSHTHSHPNIAALSSEHITHELGLSRDALIARLGPGPLHFAWPFGKWTTFSGRAAKIAYDLGYASIASAHRGSHHPRTAAAPHDQICLRRDHVMGAWPLDHNLYFIARSAAQHSPTPGPDYAFPPDWHRPPIS